MHWISTMDMKMNKLGPLNELFRTDTVTFTSPDGEVVPVKSNSLAKVNPEKVKARKALDRAREALREAEEHYRMMRLPASRSSMTSTVTSGSWNMTACP